MAQTDPRTTARYGVSKPAATHRRPATCEEVDCRFYRNGWQMRVMPDTPMGDRQAHLIKQSGRRYTLTRLPDGHLYQFEAGQQCFRVHTVDLEKPAIYLVRQGYSQPIRHTRPDNWVDDFATHLDKLRGQQS
jgi:hypothetical protein